MRLWLSGPRLFNDLVRPGISLGREDLLARRGPRRHAGEGNTFGRCGVQGNRRWAGVDRAPAVAQARRRGEVRDKPESSMGSHAFVLIMPMEAWVRIWGRRFGHCLGISVFAKREARTVHLSSCFARRW